MPQKQEQPTKKISKKQAVEAAAAKVAHQRERIARNMRAYRERLLKAAVKGGYKPLTDR